MRPSFKVAQGRRFLLGHPHDGRPGVHDLTLSFLRKKRDQTRRLAGVTPVDLGIPGIAVRSSAGRE
ncbi:hypothetical protein [Streptomyces sp. TE33382]